MVAIIEDDESYRLAVQTFAESGGFSVQSFGSAEGSGLWPTTPNWVVPFPNTQNARDARRQLESS